MTPRPPTRNPFWPMLLLLAAGCSSLPADFEGARSLRVAYHDFRTGSDLTLVNQDDPRFADLYSRPNRNPTTKLAPRDELLAFVRTAAEKGFFEDAEPIAQPEEAAARRPFRMLTIEADGKAWSVVLYPGLGREHPDVVRRFTELQTAFVGLYNSVPQLQYVPVGEDGESYFERERQRLERENLERIGGGGR